MKTVAIIPAGGSGRRAGASIAKQYLLLHGVPLLARTLRVFQNAEAISAIVLVVPTPDVESVRERIVEKYSLTKVAAVVAGGGSVRIPSPAACGPFRRTATSSWFTTP